LDVARPGGYIVEREHFLVEHAPLPSSSAGTVIIETRRHLLDFGEMTPAELTQFGENVQRLVPAIKTATGVERVYLLVLMLETLGKPGVAGDGRDTFNEPNAVLIAPDGEIFVSDGHEPGPGHNARVVKLDANGKFVSQWGGHGVDPGQFEMPHALAMDSQGRLFVADRGNNRIQIFDQSGKFG
jgi:hypothetical protein